MDQKTMVKQVFDFQKNTFENFFKSLSTIQDQAEKSMSFMLDRYPWLPEESKNVILEWGRIYKKGRADFKRAMDDGYEKMESYFMTTAQAAQQATRLATEAGKKASDQFAKSTEGKQESRPA
jgi:predicted DNA-binding WGR domain protein